MLKTTDNLLDTILNGSGYSTELKLEEIELQQIRSFIKDHACRVISQLNPDASDKIFTISPSVYHKYPELIEHDKLWTKKNRIFPSTYTSQIKEFPFFKKLTKIFGPFKIANEEGIYAEEIYWRLVRPNMKTDIGPLHRDKWFWDLGYGSIPDDYFRIKIWISIWCDPGKNGLRIGPFSHTESYDYTTENRGGLLKPCFDENKYDLNIVPLDSNPGDCVIFNDETLHGGVYNSGENSRVSIEFTMLLPNSVKN
ncbi:MAG: hypothetical protein S4CHLAM7_07130 [Chlamydiae bacterium]|nr:hypothetical protein [Chlamydiota bacterium]